MRTVENMKFSFSPEMNLTESTIDDVRWLNIGGVALTECKSKNKNRYRMENLQENNGKAFKWLVGHPNEPEKHVVGKGTLKHEGSKLYHEGAIRNTADYPDIIEKVKDKFYGPSIHASASKVTYDEDKDEYKMEGLSIDGVGLVAFQGVEQASIDYAIAESFERQVDKIDKVENIDKDKGENTMTQEEIKPEDKPEVSDKEEAAVARLEAVQKELNELKESKKLDIVSKIIEMNSDLDKEKLMVEEESQLNMRLEYETKLAENAPQESAVVTEDEEEEDKEEVVEEKDGSVSMTQEAYSQFNKELVDRIR